MPENQLDMSADANEGRAPRSALVLPYGSLAISRRRFVASLGASAAASLGVSALGCSTKEVTLPPPPSRRITGDVVDTTGANQPSLGRLLLMYENGLQTGRSVDVDPAGRFTFTDVPAGNWQLRYHAPGAAFVPEIYPHPIRISVRADETTNVHVIVEHGWEDGEPMIEIYAGDYFFQEQPSGKENSETIVKLGVPVCWYNVGLVHHRITGPFWTSPDLDRTASFIWVPDRTGVFPYTCTFHQTQMIATLRVVP